MYQGMAWQSIIDVKGLVLVATIRLLAGITKWAKNVPIDIPEANIVF